MPEFDEKVLDVFLEKQLQLFPEEVAATREEAKDFLDECMAVVVKGAKEVWTYFDEEGVEGLYLTLLPCLQSLVKVFNRHVDILV